MKKLYCSVALIICILVPSLVFAGTIPKLVGKWGYANIKHNNDGTWYSESGIMLLNSDGTGSSTYKYNDNGSLNTGTLIFTYSATSNLDGSTTLTFLSGAAGTRRCILSDDGKMFVQDSTGDTSRQTMHIGIKMDISKTYSNADLNGGYYDIMYQSYINGTRYYEADSSTIIFNGPGSYTSDTTSNANGTIATSTGFADTYTMDSDGTIHTGTGYTGYLSGDSTLGILAVPTIDNKWKIVVLVKKGDKAYSTSDLAGTWVLSGLGDSGGTSFATVISTMTCDSNGGCVHADKNQTAGALRFGNHGFKLAVASDGSFGGSIALGSPPYAAAMSDNGKTIVINGSFDQSNPNSRQVVTGIKCNNCYNIAGQMIPMLDMNIGSNDTSMNLYLYDPVAQAINTIKEDGYQSWLLSLTPDQTLGVYSDGPYGDTPRGIYAYNSSSRISTLIGGKSTRWNSVYFDSNGKILFIDNNDGSIKRMDSNGANVTTLTTPASPYTFRVFWMSPDRKLIAAIEERSGTDYYTTNYDRVVVIDASTGVRISTRSEYLGEWQMVSWKPDSSAFMYYHHIFNVSGGIYQGSTQKYIAFSNLWSNPPTATDFAASYMAGRDDVVFYTKSGNFLSLTYQELYNGQTGALIANRSADVPLPTDAMFGFDGAGEIYFANWDKTNFRRFIELPASAWQSIPGAIVSPPALAWNPIDSKAQMVVRGTGDTIWSATFKSDGTFNSDWLQIPGAIISPPALAWNPINNKAQMVVRGTGDTIWSATFKSDGTFNSDWLQIPGAIISPPALAWNPVSNTLQMVVRGSGDTIWSATFKSDGTFNYDWAQIPGAIISPPALAWNPVSNTLQMVVRGSGDTIWSATFKSDGTFNYDWAQIPGTIISPPALAWDPWVQRIQMMVRGSSNTIWTATFNSGGVFNGDWTQMPGAIIDPPAIIWNSVMGNLMIVVRGTNNSIWAMEY